MEKEQHLLLCVDDRQQHLLHHVLYPAQLHREQYTCTYVCLFVIIVYHVTIVAIGHWLLKKCWPSVIVFYALQGVPLYETMQTRLLR